MGLFWWEALLTGFGLGVGFALGHGLLTVLAWYFLDPLPEKKAPPPAPLAPEPPRRSHRTMWDPPLSSQ